MFRGVPDPTVDRPAGREDLARERARALEAAAGAPPGSRSFEAARVRARGLGARVMDRADDGRGRVVFRTWSDEARRCGAKEDDLRLELWLPPDDLDPGRPPAEATFRRLSLPVERDGAWVTAVLDEVPIGTRKRLGALHRLRLRGLHGDVVHRPDPLTLSAPFGAFAPTEVVDEHELHEGRTDAGRFHDLAARAAPGTTPRFGPPTNVLQLHVGTATAGGTVADLVDRLRGVAEKLRTGATLSPLERCFAEFDALQPLPLEPTIERERGPAPWAEPDEAGDPPSAHGVPDAAREVRIALRKPDAIDWGYDVATVGGAAANPALLRSGRPHELIDLAQVLHAFPDGPRMLILDVVYGHADDQALALLDPAFVRGPNMYGQDVNQGHPVVRAILLEMLARRVGIGADGIRVDGAQDLTTYDPRTGELAHDDAFLKAMGDVEATVAGVRYRPFCIFEDGRPWPRPDWPTASTYRAVTERQPHAFQWGPLTFAHNTPALRGFWRDRWWRVEEIARHGGRWITGCANHDTVRRGAQLDPDGPLNRRLGRTPAEIHERAYDHPAAALLTHLALPGVGMEFLNALARAPWGFVRDTDHRYATKVAAEEARFLTWRVDEAGWDRSDAFPRLKRSGIDRLADARRLLDLARTAVEDDPHVSDEDVAEMLRPLLPAGVARPFGAVAVRRLALAYLRDAADWCVVDRHAHAVPDEGSAFGARVRAARRARPWLTDALGPRDDCTLAKEEGAAARAGAERVEDRSDGADRADVVRFAPDGSERLWTTLNLEGPTFDAELPRPRGTIATRWIASPGARLDAASGRVRLPDGEGVVRIDRSR